MQFGDTMGPNVIRFSVLLLFLFAMITSSALSKEPIDLFEPTDSRSLVIRTAYAYYPDNAELRVRLTLENRTVKSGSYKNTEVVRHLLSILNGNDHNLFCTYKDNVILSVFTEPKLWQRKGDGK